jgi:hypothetical protein
MLKWIPWKYFLKRTAKTYDFIDPLTLLARLRSFAQPSEIQEPIELLREGIKFHARGLINTKAIQHNLDWIWPFWVEKQYNPNDPSFIPRAFSFSHINLAHRNWTALGLPNLSWYPIIDPRGLVTPLYNGWSLDFWVVTGNGRKMIPSKLHNVEQHLELKGCLRIKTSCCLPGIRLIQSAEVVIEDGTPILVVSVHVQASSGGWLVTALRPYNPEGVQFIEQIVLEDSRQVLLVDNRNRIYLEEPPSKILFSGYAEGDVVHKLEDEEKGNSVRCRIGMATAAAVYNLQNNHWKQLNIRIPFQEETASPIRGISKNIQNWSSVLKNTACLEIPDGTIQYLYDTAVRTLILLSAGDIVPGPYTYRRFWFRDACFMINALMVIGLTKRCRNILAKFPKRQKRSGYFQSQDGEWDSNGQVLWIYNRYERLSGELLDRTTRDSIYRGVKWIWHKRLPKNQTAHAGLLPPGFSAEHLGPNDYYYWDNFWAVAGLKAAAEMVKRCGSESKSKEIDRLSKDLKKSIFDSIEKIPEKRSRGGIPASPYRRMDAGAIGSLVSDYPLQLTPPGDRRITATLSFLLESCFHSGAFFQDMIHSGLNVYLTLAIAQSLLRMEDNRYRSLIHAVKGLASSTGQWPEAIHPHTGGGCMGDGQHGWAAAEWVMMIRNLFVREEGCRLILCSGILPEWLQPESPIRFGPTPTLFGKISIKIIQIDYHMLEVSLNAEPKHIQAKGEINIPEYQSLPVIDWKGVYRVKRIEDPDIQ